MKHLGEFDTVAKRLQSDDGTVCSTQPYFATFYEKYLTFPTNLMPMSKLCLIYTLGRGLLIHQRVKRGFKIARMKNGSGFFVQNVSKHSVNADQTFSSRSAMAVPDAFSFFC